MSKTAIIGSMAQLLLFNKPYNVLCQFTDDDNNTRQPSLTLADFIQVKQVYPAGRLDKDSEGLVLLTDDGKLQHQIASPERKMSKTYWVQVEGEIDTRAINLLQKGVRLKDGLTRPATAKLIPAPQLWPRTPPIRERKNIPTSWLSLTISEGKNRQVRRMTAAVGFPTLRLVRYRIGSWTLDGIAPGQYLAQPQD